MRIRAPLLVLACAAAVTAALLVVAHATSGPVGANGYEGYSRPLARGSAAD